MYYQQNPKKEQYMEEIKTDFLGYLSRTGLSLAKHILDTPDSDEEYEDDRNQMVGQQLFGLTNEVSRLSRLLDNIDKSSNQSPNFYQPQNNWQNKMENNMQNNWQAKNYPIDQGKYNYQQGNTQTFNPAYSVNPPVYNGYDNYQRPQSSTFYPYPSLNEVNQNNYPRYNGPPRNHFQNQRRNDQYSTEYQRDYGYKKVSPIEKYFSLYGQQSNKIQKRNLDDRQM